MTGHRVTRLLMLKIRAVAVPIAAVLLADVCLGQTALRSVAGKVTDDSGAIIEGAVVQLRNILTQEVRLFVTQSDGRYRFHGLHPLIDFSVRAQFEGRWSGSRTISRLDTNSIIRIDLKIPTQNRTSTRTMQGWLDEPRLTSRIFSVFDTSQKNLGCDSVFGDD